MRPVRHNQLKKVDPVCTRCGQPKNNITRAKCGYDAKNKLYYEHSFQDPTQAKFDSTLRKKGDEELDRIKRKAKKIDWEALYKVQKEETHEVYQALSWARKDLAMYKARNKKLKKIIWSIVGVVILLGYLILR